MAVWTSLHAHLHQTLRSRTLASITNTRQSLLPKNCSLLVAVSGGQDSQCLLRLLTDLRPKWQWQICSIHCNHRWRTDADSNARFVRQLAQQWGIPCRIEVADESLKSEADARRWRYQVFETVAQETGCTHVVTGHTASDRAETLLYNLVRGSGLDGLQALPWSRPLSKTATHISLVRPLLDITRAETAEFCESLEIPIWQDTTNDDRIYARNRLRLDVFPLLRACFNPQVDTALSQTAELVSAEVDYLETQTERLFQECVKAGEIERHLLRAAPLALQRRVIRRVLSQYLRISPRFDHIEKIVALLGAPNRSQSDPFPGQAIAIVRDPWIVFSHYSSLH